MTKRSHGLLRRTIDRFKEISRKRRLINRYHVINYFARRRNSQKYLEIGVYRGECFERVICPQKIGVDPNPMIVKSDWDIRQMRSDDFFAENRERFDLVFIDGLHHSEQVFRDVLHSLAVLNPGGVVLLHDCSPPEEVSQVREMDLLVEFKRWNGDVWKVIPFIRKSIPQVFCRVLDHDEGIGIIIPNSHCQLPELTPQLEAQAFEFFRNLSWSDLDQNRAECLGLLSNRLELERALMRLADVKDAA